MDSGFTPSYMQEAGLHSTGVPGMSLPSDYGLPQPFDAASLYEVVSSSNVQGLPMPPYSGPFLPNDEVSTLNNRSSGITTAPPVTSASFANMGTIDMNTNTSNSFDTFSSAQTMSNVFTNLPRQWPPASQPPTNISMAGPMPRFSYFSNANTHTSSPAQTAQMFTAPTRLSEVQDEPQHRPTPNPFAVAFSALDPVSNSGASYRSSRNVHAFPHSGSSAGSSHHRRNQRTTTLTPTPVIPAHHRARSIQSSRVRTRPASMTSTTTYTGTPSIQQQTTQSQSNQPAISTTLETSTRPTARLEYASMQHQRSSRNLHDDPYLDELLRDVPSQYRAIYRNSLAGTPAPSKTKKLVEAPKEARPEPKETEEMTINMECKICMGQVVDTVLLPCGHAILCRWCADELMPSSKGCLKERASCPMCREPVKQKATDSIQHRIYFP
ncbi:C3HC4 finger protein [Aspergillus foveolatus]|uniref:C3HC4 finger protein n=1 Tax=Aspergillus foveolatus TaxID=210207 RepID=UPI003CCE173C